MTSRDRVMRALNFQPTDRLPRDLGGMRSTGISAFAYPKLVAALGLPPRRPRIEDIGQMLALPDLDVLDALACDVVTICDSVTNAFEQPSMWQEFDFNGRLPARVKDPGSFTVQPDGTIFRGTARMGLSSYVFDEPHGGQVFSLTDDLPKVDLRQCRKDLEAFEVRDEKIKAIRDLCRQVRESTDRAVFFNDEALSTFMGIGGWGGIAVFPLMCMLDADNVAELHAMGTELALKNYRALVPEIRPYVDIIMVSADDWGTQQNLIASPEVYRTLFLPCRRKLNDACHQLAPEIKLFLHSCGALYNLIDLIIESGFDILNPVQWPAGGHTYQEWKDKARRRIAFWGGGVNSQATLPLGTVEAVRQEASRVAAYMGQDSGYVFCNIHNILAEIPPEKVIACYNAV